MNLSELKQRIDFIYNSTRTPDNVEVVITTSESSIGGRAKCSICRIDKGFDWEHNQVRIEPTNKLIKKIEE